jgi:hypothetical protein
MEKLFYNPQQHKIQSQVNNIHISKKDNADYINNKWVSEALHSKYLITTNASEPYQLMDKKFAFTRSFLNRMQNKKNSNNSEIPELNSDNSEIPKRYLELLESDIFSGDTNPNVESNQELWEGFTKWTSFSKVKTLKSHCKNI